MIEPVVVPLLYAPENAIRHARVVTLTRHMIEVKIMKNWWLDAALKPQFDPIPIDRHWNWADAVIDFEGTILQGQTVGLQTDDGEIQGAMLLSSQPAHSFIALGSGSLFVELLCTAPRNRSHLRIDESDLYIGAGVTLLKWAGSESRRLGCEGRLRLDASPEHLGWYEKRGFQKLPIDPVSFENVQYTPMECARIADRPAGR